MTLKLRKTHKNPAPVFPPAANILANLNLQPGDIVMNAGIMRYVDGKLVFIER